MQKRSVLLPRRSLLTAVGAGGLCWLTPLAERLARASESRPQHAQSVIVLWLQGGPSQLETFDPHAGTNSAAGTRSRRTAVKGIELAEGLEQLADLMADVSLVRSLVSKEGDHERATYYVKTGFRPDPTLVHPALGSVICHMLPDNLEIPRHISILPGQWPARGGYLGDQYDAFKIGDPQQPIPDVASRVSRERQAQRINDLLNVVEPSFASGRLKNLDQSRTLHSHGVRNALKLMSSEQLTAFDLSREPRAVRSSYGETPFGRGCLAAARLIETGVRCVEVELGGWDTHLNNHEFLRAKVPMLDQAFAALLHDLKRRNLFDRTIVLCGGEFGRTPRLNATGGRDHWPHGFSMALAGGSIVGGRVVGETAANPQLDVKDLTVNVSGPRSVADIHATIYQALGIDFTEEITTPIGRPLPVSEGQPIQELLNS